MLTVEVGLRNSNPSIRSRPYTESRSGHAGIQKRSYRNLGQAADAVACASIRQCRVGIAAPGPARTTVPAGPGREGRPPRPGREAIVRSGGEPGRSTTARGGDPDDFVRHREYIR